MGQITDNMKARRMWVMGMGQGGQGGGDPTAPGAQPNQPIQGSGQPNNGQPNNGQPIDMSSLIAMLAGNVAQSQQNQGTYNDLLKQRQQYIQSAENGVGDQAQNLIDNGINGVSVSPAETLAPVLNFHTDNANKTADFTNRMFGFGEQATQGLGALANIIGTQNSNNVANKQLNLDYLKEGFTPPDGSNTTVDSSGNPTSPRINDYVKQIMGGQTQVTDVPVGLRPIVQNELNKQGFDPALPINTYVKDLEDTFNGNGKDQTTLAHGNNPMQSLLDKLGGVVAPINKSSREQRMEDYNTKKNAFQSQLYSLVSDKRIQTKVANELLSSLPDSNATPQQANTLFGALENAIRDAYYNGGPRPTPQGQGVQLKSPTGQVFHYADASDPEIKQAFNSGYRQL